MLRPGTLMAKIVAVALLAVVLLAGYRFLAQPVLQAYTESNEDIVRSKELLQRYQALAAEQPALSGRLAAFEDDQQMLSGYLEGPSDALAAAQLQDLAAEAVAMAGGEILSTQILQASDVEGGPPSIRRTGLKLRFSATIDGLASALYELETIEPRLFINQLMVVSANGRRRVDRNNSESSLDVRLDLFGYVLKTE